MEDREPEDLAPGAELDDDLRIESVIEDYRTMQDIVFTALRNDIFAGKLKPGERLNTARLAERLGVSRMPVREALSRLISVGLVENLPHRGTFVKKLSVDDVVEIYCIRAALEGIAARLAAPRLGPEEIGRISDLTMKIEHAVKAGDDRQILALNFEFHDIIYQAAHAPNLYNLILQYYRHSEQYRALGLDLPGRYLEIMDEHRAILAALQLGDVDAAERSARQHHLNTARRIVSSMGSNIII